MRIFIFSYFFLCGFHSIGQEDSVFLKNIKVIDAITVSANSSIVFDRPNLYLIDFYVDSIGCYVLLKKNNNYLLSHLSESFDIQSTLLLPFKPISLDRNCMNELYIISRDSVYQVAEHLSEVEIYEPNPLSFYEQYFMECQLETPDHLVYKVLHITNQIVRFDAVNKEKEERIPFYYAYDSIQVQTASEWQQILMADGINAYSKEPQLDIALILMEPEKFQRYTYYQNVISKEDYNPMFRNDTSIHLFNHYIDSFVCINSQSFKVETNTPISFHKIKGWKKEILLDQSTNIYYTIYLNEGALYISELDQDNFGINRSRKIEDAILTKRMMVFDGFLYYDTKDSYETSFNQLQRLRL